MRFKCDSLDTPHTMPCGIVGPFDRGVLVKSKINARIIANEIWHWFCFDLLFYLFSVFICYFVAQNVTEFKHAL